jgi:hypothetical protein
VFAPWLGAAAVVVSVAALARAAVQTVQFARESRSFEVVLAHAQPGARAFSFILDRRSAVSSSPVPYAHFPLWYQADKHGFVDLNYAFYSQQIVRFAAAPPPVYAEAQLRTPVERLDWRRDGLAGYRYFFVRHTAPLPVTLFAGAGCPPVLIAASGAWELFENQTCFRPTIRRETESSKAGLRPAAR